MKSLIWKEAREAAVIALPLIAIVSAMWLTTAEFDDVLLAPRRDPFTGVMITAAAAGMLLAFLQFGSERWLGTQRLLVHRGTGHRGAFLAKALVGGACAWAIGCAPMLVFASVHAFGPNGAVIHWERVGEYAVAACGAWPAYAIVAWVVQLRRGVRELFLLLTAAPSALLSIGAVSSYVGSTVFALGIAWFAMNALVALVFSALALRAFAEHRDPDLVLSKRDLVAGALLSPWLWLIVAAGLVASIQRGIVQAIAADHPRVIAEVPGEGVVAAREVNGRWYAVDARGEADPSLPIEGGPRVVHSIGVDNVPPVGNWITLAQLAGRAATGVDEPARHPWRRWSVLGVNFERYESPTGAGSWSRWIYFDHVDGVLRLVGLRVAPYFGRDKPPSVLSAEPPFERTFGRGEGKRFEMPVVIGITGGNVCIADLADATLWRIEPQGEHVLVSALSIPGVDDAASARQILASVQRGGQIWVGDRRLGFDGKELVAQWPEPAKYELAIESSDPLELAVRVERRDTHATVLAARFEPSTPRQRVLATVSHGFALLRPPLVALQSFFGAPWSSTELDARTWDREPLLAGGARAGLLALILAFGLASVVLVVRRQRRMGHSPAVIVLSALVTACFGVWAALWFAHLEPRTKPRVALLPRAEREPEPVIQTA